MSGLMCPSWLVCSSQSRKSWIGIVETNYAFAVVYWTQRGHHLLPNTRDQGSASWP